VINIAPLWHVGIDYGDVVDGCYQQARFIRKASVIEPIDDRRRLTPL
jgi:hypothetical protein